MKPKNYGKKNSNLKKRINKRQPKAQKTKKKIVIQKKFTPSKMSCCACCLNEKETLSRAFKVKQILEKREKYGNLFVKGCFFRNDENLKEP